jgi:hypothetical protein
MYSPYFETRISGKYLIRHARIENTVSDSYSIVTCFGNVLLQNRCLTKGVFSGSNNPAFRRHITCSVLKAALPEYPRGVPLFSNCSLLRAARLEQAFKSCWSEGTQTHRLAMVRKYVHPAVA